MSKLQNAGTRFTKSSVRTLKHKVSKVPVSTIAKLLGRTTKAVRRKAEKLGLSTKVTK